MAESQAESAQPWMFGDEAACRYLASVSWPWEREENRDAWAVTMLRRPDLLAREIEAARERLESAIAALSGYCFPPAQPDVNEVARAHLAATLPREPEGGCPGPCPAACGYACHPDVSTPPAQDGDS